MPFRGQTPRPWSVYRWLDGKHATVERIADLSHFATDLARFLAALYQIDPEGGPAPGRHNFFRGGPIATYDAQAREAIAILGGEIDTHASIEVWKQLSTRDGMALPFGFTETSVRPTCSSWMDV
jgi:aminoglycoside phosphotransferase (APT) family kinase protein